MQKERLLGKKEIHKNGKAIQMEKMTYGMLSKYRTELMGIAAVSVLITHASDTIVVSDMPLFFSDVVENWNIGWLSNVYVLLFIRNGLVVFL